MSDTIVHVTQNWSPSQNFILYITKGEKVELHTYKNESLVGVKVFRVGDEVEYDSFNLRYTGPIVGITEKSVIVKKGRWSNAKTCRMKLDSFASRNWNFNMDEVAQYNSIASMNI
jgi:hypothetical protein